MTNTYTQYEEIKIPEEILTKLEEAAGSGTSITLGEAGVFDWINERSANDGWRVVWQAFNFPFLVFEREVVVEQVEN